MNGIRLGEKLKFRKFSWTITERRRSIFGVEYFRYRVHRKYRPAKYERPIMLSNTTAEYDIMPQHWLYIRRRLEKDPNYHYTMR